MRVYLYLPDHREASTLKAGDDCGDSLVPAFTLQSWIVAEAKRTKREACASNNHRIGPQVQRLGGKFWNGETISPSNPQRQCGN